MFTAISRITLATLVAPALALTVCVSAAHAETLLGESGEMGNGTVQTFADMNADGSPRAIGLTIAAGLLDNLPAQRNQTGRCFDLDGNGSFSGDECEGDYELRLDMPEAVRSRPDIIFEWVGFNWNPLGHVPPGVYDLPHFDMHFYTVSEAAIDNVRLGPCEGYINCEDRERALKPLPAKFAPEGYIDVGAAVGRMGNHLLDASSPELQKPPGLFTHTWIYGADDGKLIFWEPMITRAFLLERPDVCILLKQPPTFERTGFYPTSYCMRYLDGDDRYTITMEGFVLREAGT